MHRAAVLSSYMVTHLLADLGWVYFDFWMFPKPLGCTAAAVLPKQDRGTYQI